MAFQQALTQAQPVLAEIRNLPPGQPGSQPLLRVAAYSQSETGAPVAGTGRTISLQFNIAAP